MGGLLEKLERPVLTDIQVSWPKGTAVEAYPTPFPDLYHGEPVSITAKLVDAGGPIVLSGTLGGKHWQTELHIDKEVGSTSGVAAAWARDKISSLEESRIRGADPAAARAEILKLALKYTLVSRYTSLVAVDVTPSRPKNEDLTSGDVPLMLPEGWEWDKVFGEQSVAPAGVSSPPPAIGLPKLRTASLASVSSPVVLPQTATPARMYLVLGILLVLWSAAIMLARRPPFRV
jgi:Ca-activated chloride channel family protein